LVLLVGRVAGANPGHHPKGGGEVVNVGRLRSAGLEAEGRRKDPVSIQQTVGGLQAQNTVGRRRSSDGPACVGAHSKRGISSSNRDACAAGRSCWRSPQIVWISRLAAKSTVCARRRELRHVHLCQNDYAGIAKLLHKERIV